MFPTRLLTSEDEYKWFWHQMIYFPGTINIVSTRLYCHIIYINNGFTSHLQAMHVNLLCACWHSEAVKGSSSLSSRRLLISLCITSFLFLCPEPTDAPCPYYGDPAPPFPRWRPHPQGPHTPPLSRVQHSKPANISHIIHIMKGAYAVFSACSWCRRKICHLLSASWKCQVPC